MRKSFFIIGLVSTILLVGSVGFVVSANTTSFQSQGRIVFTNDTLETSDDVIFDSSDFTILNNKIDATTGQVTALQTGFESHNQQLQTITSDVEQLQQDVTTVTDSLGGMKFGYDETEQKYGYYKKEADTDVFVPFKSGGELVLLGNFSFSCANATRETKTYTYDISTMRSDYATLTNDNFIVAATSWSLNTGYQYGTGGAVGKSYNASTGILTVTVELWCSTDSTQSFLNKSASGYVYMV